MAKQFKNQAGVSSSNPTATARWLMSKLMSRLLSRATVEKLRDKARSY